MKQPENRKTARIFRLFAQKQETPSKKEKLLKLAKLIEREDYKTIINLGKSKEGIIPFGTFGWLFLLTRLMRVLGKR